MLNNRIDSTELIRIADAVAAEIIDKDLVLTSMETAIEKAARTRYGSENDIYVSIDRVRYHRTWKNLRWSKGFRKSFGDQSKEAKVKIPQSNWRRKKAATN